MAIRKLKLKADSFTLTYSITLPLPESDAQPAAPILEAQDDLGNEYLDWGGAYGPSPHGSSTHGTLSGRPALPAEARTLHVRFTFLRAGSEQSHEASLQIPGSVAGHSRDHARPQSS
ncbi:hypothetical protein OHB53_40815 [Streptomyces sp. NBC_00056]|uniref:hypothetical protein n=1 Tax=unclassified Streptomyces TaxID=2593676 RepID=UPI00324DB5B6